MFITPKVIKELKLPLKIKKAHRKYSFMVLSIKDLEYDVKLAFGVKLVGMLSEKVHIYVNGAYWCTRIRPIGKKKENFRKKVIKTIFPKEMTYDERAIWRKEHMKHLRSPGKHPMTKFYSKWLDSVTFKEPLIPNI